MSFEDVKGQGEAIKFLKAAISSGKMAHAYIFAGPVGCGRSLLARNFAKAVNCENLENAPCDLCLSCRKIDKDIHPDVRWIKKDEKNTEIKIDEIRKLESQIILKPYEGRYKVYIVVNAELMSMEAANSFLKTLEEPPPNSLLILTTGNTKDLLLTIVSRCQVMRLKPPPIDKPTSILTDVLEEFSDDECIENYAAANRSELSGKLNVLVSWYRDLLVFKSTSDGSLLIYRDRIDDIKKSAMTYKADELMRIFEGVLNAKEKIESNVNPKLALSAMFNEDLRCMK